MQLQTERQYLENYLCYLVSNWHSLGKIQCSTVYTIHTFNERLQSRTVVNLPLSMMAIIAGYLV